MISATHRAIFIHIPKTGGTSIESKLGLQNPTGSQDHRTIRHLQPVSFRHVAHAFPAGFNRAHRISRRKLLKDAAAAPLGLGFDSDRLDRQTFESYFKFTCVRNPWARVYSRYRHVCKYPKDAKVYNSFEEFVGSQLYVDWALRPQLDWITDYDGKIPLDRIIRFEAYAREVPEVLAALGFEDLEMPHLLKRGADDYRRHYPAALADQVGRRYAREIALFDYRFE